MSDYIRQHAVAIDYKLDESWIILSEIEQSIKKKIEAVGTPLKDWDISINYGIKTGLNEAFIISKEKRDELIKADPKSAEIIRPILRGRDIRRYEVDFQNLYLINTHNGYVSENGEVVPPINIEDYPAIKDWLDNGAWNKKIDQGTNIERLAKRTDQGVTPYNLRSLAYMDDFSKPKLIYPNMTKYLPFYFDEEQYLTNQKAFIVTGESIGTLTAFCNSKLFKFVYLDNFPELQGGTRELSKVFFEKLFVKKASISDELEYLKLIKEIQKCKLLNKETTFLERKLNEKIFDFYKLTYDEILAINQVIDWLFLFPLGSNDKI